MLLLNIALTIVLPIFLLIGIGVAVDRRFQLDILTLNRLNFYVFVPAVVFTTAYGSELAGEEIAGIVVFTVAHHLLMIAIGLVIFSLPYFKPYRPVLTLGAAFYNTGNYGIPLMRLAFGEDAVGVVSIVLAVHSLLFFSVGLLLFVGTHEKGLRGILLQIVRYPALYAIAIGLIMRALRIDVPLPVISVLDYLMGGFVGIALLTLGVQLSRCPIAGNMGPVSAVMVARLAISPLLAALMISFFEFEPLVAAVLILGTALPTAVNVYILAREVDHSPDLASRLVFWTTMASAAAVPVVLLILGTPQ